MKLTLRKKFLIILVLLFSLLILNLALGVSATGLASPGSEEDPIVSKSYVDKYIKSIENENLEIKRLLSAQGELIKQLSDKLNNSKSSSSDEAGFKVVGIESGQVVYTDSGTEIILRSGKATSIKGSGGGLADTTSARDLVNGMLLSTNHLLISAQNDGRGFKTNSKCWLLIRGNYRLINSKTE